MGKKSAPPPAPDYTQAAEKTAASSQEAQTRADWANRPTINTPWGQESWNASAGVDPATGQAITRWEQNTSLTPETQAALDSQMRLQMGRSQLGESFMGRVGQEYSQPFDYSNLQGYGQGGRVGNQGAWYTGGAGQGIQQDVQGTGQGIQSSVPGAGQGIQTGLAGAGEGIQQGLQGAGQGMMAGLDRGQLGAMPDSGMDARVRIEDAMMARMRPQHEQAQAGLEGKLQNMGLTRGSEAWNREMQRMGDQQSRERFNALDRGLQEQQGQFGMGMQGRQQGWQEMMGQGQFQNQAQEQAFRQAAQAGQFGNQAQQQAWQQRAQAGEFGNQAQNQMFGQNLQNTQLGNQAQQQAWQQFLGQGQFGNQAQQQAWQQRMGQNAQNFGQEQAAQGQNFSQQMQQSEYQNRLRQQQIAEQMQRRGMSLNEMNALLTGQQVGMPSMPNFNTSQSAGGVNYSGAAQNQYNASMDAYNAKQQQQQSMMSGIGQVAGMAGMMMMSDVRLKSNIVRVGTHPVGVGIYEYDIQGERERGVLAQELQEVRPDLVHVHRSGYLMVNYGGLQ